MEESADEENPFFLWLRKKKIHPERFAAGRPLEFAEWESEFLQLGPANFDSRKKFWINQFRRQFHTDLPTQT